ncbi:MAG: hypothetical protein P1U82_08760 [Verrucomicrobiales bacterium]|nr:hypothetical protein [Verrucomicrobiales bacterium]
MRPGHGLGDRGGHGVGMILVQLGTKFKELAKNKFDSGGEFSATPAFALPSSQALKYISEKPGGGRSIKHVNSLLETLHPPTKLNQT